MTTRRTILLAGLASALSACGGSGGGSGGSTSQYQPNASDTSAEGVIRTSIAADDWPMATPASQGIHPDLVEKLFTQLGAMAAMRGVVVIRNGKLIGERYYGDAQSSDLRHIRSATKSVTGLLTAQAIEAGKLPGRNTALSKILPAELARIPNSGAAAVAELDHVLNMSTGHTWDEDSHIPTLFKEPNVTALALGLPASGFAPGNHFNYNSAMSHLPSTMLQNAYGIDAQAIAEKTLFEALGIRQIAWSRDSTGTTHGSWGLQMRTRDLAKLAWMSTQKGQWAGKQLIPAQWFTDIINNRVNIGNDGAFTKIGYQSLYWTGMLGGHPIYKSFGFGGQFGMSVPSLNLAIATNTQWNVDFAAGNASVKQLLNAIAFFLAELSG